jgi:hypothetical protein
MTRKEMRAAACEKLTEAMNLLASAGLLLLAERLRSWPYRLISRPPTNLTANPVGSADGKTKGPYSRV